nr:POLD3 protein [Hymenolepis microstoma]
MEDAVLSSLNQHFEEKDGIASYKSLSIDFGWSLEESQLNLERYIERHAEVIPIFRISGFQCMNDDQWSYVVRLTTSNDLATHKDLSESKKHNVDALACFDKSLEQDPVSHPLLVSFPWKYTPPNSSDSARIAKIKSPKPSPVKPQSRMEPITKKSSVPSVPTVAPRKSVKRPPPKSRLQSSLKFESKTSKPEKLPEKVEDIPDPFADSDEDAFEEAELIQNKRRRLVFSSDEEGEVKEKKAVESNVESCSGNGAAKVEIGSPPKSVPKISAGTSKANHKSPRKQKTSRKSNSKKKEPVLDDDDEAIKLSPAKGVKKKSKVGISKVKQGSDEEMFELEPAQGVKKEKSPQPPCHVNTTRKRQVTKTFMDDDGYLITEKVWEEVDESKLKAEESEPPKPEPAVETKNAPSPVTNTADSKRKKTKQSTLMSFFKK